MSVTANRKPHATEDAGSYTPVVFPDDGPTKGFESSLPSLSSVSGFSPHLTYLEDLQRKHHALAQIVREEPPSPPRYPDDDDNEEGSGQDHAAWLASREQRIAALRRRVQEAYVKAEGNPADGKWIFLTHLLRMESTSGRYGRWAGTRTDLRTPEPLEGPGLSPGPGLGLGWINAETEVEWREWERRYDEERRVREKVENWKRRVLPPSKGPSLAMEGLTSMGSISAYHQSEGPSASNNVRNSQPVQDAKAGKAKVTVKAAGASTSQQALADPLRDAAPFGFGVVKRASQNTNGAGGKPVKPAASSGGGPKRAEDGPEGNPGPKKKGAEDSGAIPTPHREAVASSSKAKNAAVNHIADIPDTSFLPSFSSSQFLTSTPKPDAKPPSKSIPTNADHDALPQIPPQLQSIQPQGNQIPIPLFLPTPSSPSPPVHLAPEAVASPRVTKTYGRQRLDQEVTPTGKQTQPLETSVSLPAIPDPTTPTRTRKRIVTPHLNNAENPAPLINANNKRSLPPTTPIGTATQNQNQEEEEDVERALKRARTLSTYELMVSASVSPSRTPGVNRNRSAHRQTLTAFGSGIADSRSPKTPRAQTGLPAGHASAAPADNPSTPTPHVRGKSRAKTPSVPPSDAEVRVPGQDPSTPLLPHEKNAQARAPLPTLTALLASAKKKKSAVASGSVPSGKSVKPPVSKGHTKIGVIKEVEEFEERLEVAQEVIPAADAGGAHVVVDVSVLDTELQVDGAVTGGVESQTGGLGENVSGHENSNVGQSNSDSYPNAPAYSYPAINYMHAYVDPLIPVREQNLDLNDPHASIDPYAEPPERDSIFGGDVEYDPYVDVDLASPAKSLSSIAGSDDEDDEIDELQDEFDLVRGKGIEDVLGKAFEFDPLATSTQHGPLGGSGLQVRDDAVQPVVGSRERGQGAAESPKASQQSKDSWESVYGPAAADPRTASGPDPSGRSSTSHHPQNGSHLSSSQSAPQHPLSSSNPQPQPLSGPSSSNPFKFTYNSQFESKVAQEVEKVNKLLESDLRVDYDGWLNLRDHENDKDGEAEKGVEESP